MQLFPIKQHAEVLINYEKHLKQDIMIAFAGITVCF